jgi:hypothetical protein
MYQSSTVTVDAIYAIVDDSYGAQRFNGNLFVNGNVGIGTTTPANTLNVVGSANVTSTASPALYVSTTGTYAGQFNGKVSATNDVEAPRFVDSGSTGYYLDPAGTSQLNTIVEQGSDFALGTNDGRSIGSKTLQRALVHDASDTLVINYNGDFEGGIRMDSNLSMNGNQICLTNGCQSSWPTGGGNGWTVSGNYLYNNTAGARVGIGTATPASPYNLEVLGGGILLNGSSGGEGDLAFAPDGGGTGAQFDYSANKLYIGNKAGTQWNMVIQDDGRVGIGTVSPSGSKLDVIGGEEAIYSRNSSGGGFTFVGYNDNGKYGRVGTYDPTLPGWRNLSINEGGGNVGIGTTTPTQKLDVNGNVNVGGILYLPALANAITTNSSPVIVMTTNSNILAGFGGVDWQQPGFMFCGGDYPGTACTQGAASGKGSVLLDYGDVRTGYAPTSSFSIRYKANGNFYTRMFMDYNGNVGIGTSTITSPAKLQIDGDGSTIYLPRKSTAGDPSGSNGMIYYNSNSQKFRCYENSAWKDCDTTGGGGSGWSTSGNYLYNNTANANVGIGTSTPTQKLEVRGSPGGAFIGDGTTKTELVSSGGINYIESGNDAWNANANLYVTGYNTNQANLMYVNFATLQPTGDVNIGGNLYTTNGQLRKSTGWVGGPSTDVGIYSNQATYAMRYVTNGGDFYWFSDSGTGTTPIMTLKTLGQLGIGTSSPAYKLDVNGDVNIGGSNVYRRGGTAGTTIATCGANQYIGSATVSGGIITGGSCTNDISGGDGSGWTASGYDLYNNTAGVQVGIRTISDIDLAIGDSDTGLQQQGDGNLAVYTNNVERMRINNVGNIGIGTTTPIAKLAVKSDDSVFGIGVDGTGSYADIGSLGTADTWFDARGSSANVGVNIRSKGTGAITLKSATADVLTVTSSNNVGIGMIPGTKLDINGDMQTNGAFFLKRNMDQIQFIANSTDRWFLMSKVAPTGDNKALGLYTPDTSGSGSSGFKWYINENGDQYVTRNSNVAGNVSMGYEILSVDCGPTCVQTTVSCSSGKKLLGGGCYLTAGGTTLTASFPGGLNGYAADMWFCRSAAATTITAYAICARIVA